MIHLIFLLIPFLLPHYAQALTLEVGQSKTLPLSSDARVQVGSKSILKAIDQGDQLLIIGRKVGQTVLNIDQTQYQVQVLPSQSSLFLSELKEWVKKRKGLEILVHQGLIQVTGQLYIFKDWLEISEIAKRHHGVYQFKATPIPEALTEATEFFKAKTKELDLPTYKIQTYTPLTVLIKSKDKSLSDRAQIFFENFGMKVENSNSVLEVRPLVKTSVILAEVSKQASSAFGLEFPTAESAQLLPKFQGPQALMVSLKALETKGLGRVLASPTLNCRSGAEAEFHSGGEFPIKITGYRKQSVEWKKHGVVLKVKPVADAAGSMQIQVETEISLVDSKQLVDGLPAMKTNRVNSAFDLSGKATIVLSGLIQETWGRSQSGLFGLSQIPVLGALFRSEEFLNHKSELVVFVTPEVVTPDQLSGEIHWPKDWNNDDL